MEHFGHRDSNGAIGREPNRALLALLVTRSYERGRKLPHVWCLDVVPAWISDILGCHRTSDGLYNRGPALSHK